MSIRPRSSSIADVGFGKRHILAIWLFFGFVMGYIMRSSINVAIIGMVKPIAHLNKNDSIFDNTTEIVTVEEVAEGTCPLPFKNSVPKNHNDSVEIVEEILNQGEFEWDHKTQGVLLSSFFYGYICCQMISGYLVRLIGARYLLAISMGGTGILSLLAPLAARSHVYLLVAIRVLTGVFQVCQYVQLKTLKF